MVTGAPVAPGADGRSVTTVLTEVPDAVPSPTLIFVRFGMDLSTVITVGFWPGAGKGGSLTLAMLIPAGENGTDGLGTWTAIWVMLFPETDGSTWMNETDDLLYHLFMAS
jgi:hypothetical protein